MGAPAAKAAPGPAMSPRQMLLARRALGLPNGGRVSSRNRYCTIIDTPDDEDWRAICEMGFAKLVLTSVAHGQLYLMTRAGAEAVLLPGETLGRGYFAGDL